MRLILYLEPAKTNPLRLLIEDFFSSTREEIGSNEAQQYHPHCSLTGFFAIDEGDGAPDDGAALMVARHIDALLEEHGEGLSVSLGAIQAMHVRNGKAPSVRLGLDTCGFRELSAALAQALCLFGVDVRTKDADHISLAYMCSFPIRRHHGDDYEFSSTACAKGCLPPSPSTVPTTPIGASSVLYNAGRYLEAAQALLVGRLVDNQQWHLCLHSEEHSEELDRRHKFTLIKQWDISDSLQGRHAPPLDGRCTRPPSK